MEKHVYCLVLTLTCVWSAAQAAELSCYVHEQLSYDVKGSVPVTLEGSEYEELQTSARLLGRVAVSTLVDGSELRVLELQVSGEDGKVYKNPEGLELPVLFTVEDQPLLQNLGTAEGDTPDSIELKKAIINLLPQQAGNVSMHSQVQDMLDLLDEGKQKIELRAENKEVVLVLGNTGSGKSTFTQWIAGTENVLQSLEIQPGEFVIEDEQNKISKDTIQSMTTFPELVLDAQSGIAYYDLPGFSDTRSSSNDIATSYFTTAVIEHADAMKLVFIINYSSVRKGVDRKDFVELLRHASELVKDIDKYVDSIALVVTKVDNNYKRGKLIDDDTVIKNIAYFLEEVKRVLAQRKTIPTIPAKELIFYENAIKLLDVFIGKDVEFPKIGIFRRPDDIGSLSDMDVFMNEKRFISKMLNFLTYTDRENQDFGRTMSESSKNEINYLIEEVEKNILFVVCDVAHEVNDYLDVLVNELNNKIASFDPKNVTAACIELPEARQLLGNLINKNEIVENLAYNITNVDDLESIPKLIYSGISSLDIHIFNKTTSKLLNEGNYLHFLLSSSEREFSTRISLLAWAAAFQNILKEQIVKRNNIENSITNFTNQIATRINQDIENIGKALVEYISTSEQNIIDIKHVHDEMKSTHDTLIEMQQTAAEKGPSEYVQEILNIVNKANISIESHIPVTVTNNDIYFVELQKAIDNVIKFVQDSEKWYNFLIKLHGNLSEYDTQKNTSCKYISKSINNLDYNKAVEATVLEDFLKQCYRGEYEELYDNVKGIRLDRAKLWHLEKLFSLLFGELSHSCGEDGKMTIKGYHVLMSDVVTKACPGTVEFMEIFALNTIFINKDLNALGNQRQLAIIAPVWNVQGRRKIALDGLPGKQHYPSKASNGFYPNVHGDNGKPGNPGDTGGSFFGVGDRFINIEDLTVSADGGDGGRGQDGGDGGRGRDGNTKYIPNPQSYLKEIGWFNNGDKYDCYLFYCKYKPLVGETCTNGGKGGSGGIGGTGGKAGIINMVSTSNAIDVNKWRTVGGDQGVSGSGGFAGLPGANGRQANAYWSWPRFWDTTRVEHEDLPYCFMGDKGRGLNYEDLAEPEVPHKMNTAIVLNDYRAYASKHGAVVESFTSEFMTKITSYNFDLDNSSEVPFYY